VNAETGKVGADEQVDDHGGWFRSGDAGYLQDG
jgi:hypothetical protein